MHHASLVSVVTLLTILSGCYNPHRFQSDSADILVQWTNPKYRIVFEPLEVGGDIESTYTFRHPPSIPLNFHLVFFDVSDVNRLAAEGVHIAVAIEDCRGDVHYSCRVPLKHREPWDLRPFYIIRPPADWSSQPKGKVVRDVFEWNKLEESRAENEWTRFPPSGCSFALPGEMRLRSSDGYIMTIGVTGIRGLSYSVKMLPVIEGGYFSL